MVSVTRLDDGITCIDLEFRGQPGVIAVYLVEDAGERALIETGPTSTLDALLSGLEAAQVQPESISKLLVTHVHLDHAGAAGTFIRRFPQARLFVQEIGAPHMLDPSKLLASATRIYGDMMGRLWGHVEPVPETNLTALTDEDRVTVGNRELVALYTPGHASHHVAYHDAGRRAVLTGDVGAVRMQGADYVRPPTPPPDVDLDLWSRSLERIELLDPQVLYLTHFGPFSDVREHLRQARYRLFGWGEMVSRALERGQGRDEIVDNLRRQADPEIMQSAGDPSILKQYELASPYGMSVDGYLRYFKKQRREKAP